MMNTSDVLQTEPLFLLTAAEIARRTRTCDATVRRRLRGHIEPFAFLSQGKKEPSPLFPETELTAIKLAILSTNRK